MIFYDNKRRYIISGAVIQESEYKINYLVKNCLKDISEEMLPVQ